MSLEVKEPFQFSSSGALATTEDPREQVANHIRAMVSTRNGERLMDSNFGVSAWDLLFEDVNMGAAKLAVELQDEILLYEPRGEIVDVKAQGSAYTSAIEVQVSYRVVGQEDVHVTTVQVPGIVRSIENTRSLAAATSADVAAQTAPSAVSASARARVRVVTVTG